MRQPAAWLYFASDAFQDAEVTQQAGHCWCIEGKERRMRGGFSFKANQEQARGDLGSAAQDAGGC